MPRSKTFKAITGVAVSFAGLAGTIILLSELQIIDFEVAKLMLVALLAIYVGCGFLIAVYRFIDKLR